MNTLIGKVITWIEKNGWGYTFDKEASSLKLQAETERSIFWIELLFDADLSRIACFVTIPNRVPENKRTDIMEYIARESREDMEGHLGMEYDSGQIYFKSIVNKFSSDFPVRRIGDLIDECMLGMNFHFVAVMAIIYGDKAPKDALVHTCRHIEAEFNSAEDSTCRQEELAAKAILNNN